MESAAHRRTLAIGAIVLYLAGFLALALIQRAQLGLGHLFYLPIAVGAIALGPWWGAAGGLLGAALYDVAVYANPALPWTNVVPQTSIRVASFALVGVIVGF